MENTPHFKLTASFTIATMYAIHGRYKRTNTIKLIAINGVKSGCPVSGLIALSFSDNGHIFSSASFSE